MSQSSDVIVVDIGSRSICANVAERLSDDNFALKAFCECEYDGYCEGVWLNPDDPLSSIYKVLNNVERSTGKMKTVYVGIPADFCVVRTIYDKISFPKPKKITNLDLQELFDLNDPFAESKYTRINSEAIYYVDDKGERLRDPVGCVTSFLRANLTYVGADSKLLSLISQGLLRHGVKNVRFIQSEYAAALALFTREERERGILFADIGFSVTSILHLTGDALLEMRTFALGGSMIPAGLSNRYDIPYRVAAAILPKINLGYKEEGEYSLKYDASSYSFPVSEVNDMTKECVRVLANYLQKAVQSFKFDSAPNQKIYLTGGGLSEIRLADEYLAKCLDRSVEKVMPTTPNFARPYYSTGFGLIRYALALEKKEKFGFLKRLFNIGG